MSLLDFNPFSAAFHGAADNNLFFAGTNHHHHRHQIMNSSSSAHQCSGLRLQRETEEAYIYVVDAPGMKSEHVQMTLEQTDRNATVIHLRDGRRKKEEESPSPNDGSKPPPRFHRLLSLRSNVDADRIDACVIDGVLSITVPKLSRQEQAAEPSNNICLQMTRRTAKAQ